MYSVIFICNRIIFILAEMFLINFKHHDQFWGEYFCFIACFLDSDLALLRPLVRATNIIAEHVCAKRVILSNESLYTTHP